MALNKQKFLRIDRKTFNIICEGRNNDELRICEDGRGFKISILLEDKDVKWLMDSLEDFYWRKGEIMWEKHRTGRNHKLWVALGCNRSSEYLVL